MDLTQDSPCIIGAACRLPGGILRSNALWSVFNQGDSWELCSTLPPPSRGFESSHGGPPRVSGRGGWLGEEGVERFDPQFFGISDSEAVTLRPNIRLALELTHEALENAGIPPSSLRGRNVSVSVGVGTEDGWDMRRWRDDGPNAFDANWAPNSDPSGIPGHIAHVFNLRGSCNTVSNACASGAFALRDGIHSLYHEGAEVAIVGSLATHFSAAPFGWAVSAGVASKSGRSSAFSPNADGYSPSEGAVFFVLKRQTAAWSSGDAVHGIIRALATGHNGAMRTLITPNSLAQAALSRAVLKAARLEPANVRLLEAHGTGTPVGDALEAEGIRATFGAARDDDPLILSSSKTILGHCHGAAAQVGILKVLSCFEHDMMPPHHVKPHAEFLKGSLIVPVEPMPLTGDKLIAQVNAFGFTGSIASIIIEKPPHTPHTPHAPSAAHSYYLLPFSAKSLTALTAQIHAVCVWARDTQCTLHDLAATLALARDHHHAHRRAFIIGTLDGLVDLHIDSLSHDTTCSPIPPSHDVPLNLLNLERIDPHVFDDAFRTGPLAYLLGEHRILEAACRLYERGHTLAFESVYDRRDINPAVLRSFPFYQFDRKRCWKDSPLTPPSTPPLASQPRYLDARVDSLAGASSSSGKAAPDSQRPSSSVSQEGFEGLINTFGASIDVPLATKLAPDGGGGSHLLLTGGNGMLGAQLLSRLLATPSHTVYCIVRGDPWARLCASFPKYRLDVQMLHDARARGALHVMRTTDLCAPKLGLADVDYATLVESVDEIVHAAWIVDFNLPLVKFHPFLQCTRILAELCFEAKKQVRYHYIGSYASTFNYAGDLVPEDVLEPRVSDSLVQGYAISKLVAEHSLLRIHHAAPTAFHLNIVRIGQICGDTVTGSWSQKEMIPMMIASLPALRAFPRSMPHVTWIPSDVCADAMRDIVVSPRAREGTPAWQIIHLANPHRGPWGEVARCMGEMAGVGVPELIPFRDYVALIKRHKAMLPVTPLLPYFVSSLEEGTMPERYASLEVSSSLKYSASLAACPPIASELLAMIVRESLKGHRQAVVAAAPSPVFLFGPWSSLSSASADPSKLNDVEKRIMAVAERIRSNLADTVDVPDPDLEQQLKTLALQLTVVQMLSEQGVVPGAVLGYCFGEYAAAITAGILSEETAIDILVRRAMVLRNVKGDMLNVFCEHAIVRRSLASISSPPNIATVIGPKHLVLSGTSAQIKSAETQLTRRGIKTLLVPTSLPFHSALMETPVIKFVPLIYTPLDTAICYISGVTGGPLRGSRLGIKYWLRHMRDPLDFYRAMQYVRKTFAGESVIDIGPGVALSKMVSRYGWSDVAVVTPEEGIALSKATAGLRRPRQPPRLLPSARDPQGVDNSSGTPDPMRVALDLLGKLFGYEPSSDLLSRSLHSVGLQSMDFIRFAEHFGESTGIHITLSAFVSDAPLKAIINEARGA